MAMIQGLCSVGLVWYMIRSVSLFHELIATYMRSVYPEPEPWEAFFAEFHEWAERCPLEMTDEGRLNHLLEEVKELKDKPDDILEMADVALIIFKHMVYKQVDPYACITLKFDIIKNAKWTDPDAAGIVHRIKG